VTRFVALFAEEFARQRLHALAKVERLHYDGKPTVLFLCTHNAGRSRMALGFFQALTTDRAVGWSGGSEPGREVNPSAIAAMAERGIDISAESPSRAPGACSGAVEFAVGQRHQLARCRERLHQQPVCGTPGHR
jgi:hypothetical protein